MNGILWGSLSMKCETWTNYILYGPQEVKLKGKLCMGHGKEQEVARFGGGLWDSPVGCFVGCGK